MDKGEIIFFAIIVIAYIACAFSLNIPKEMNIFFALLLVITLIGILILKYQQKFVNEKISEICRKLSIILAILFIVLLIASALFRYAIFEIYPIFLLVIFITMFIGWFFKKEE